MQRLRRRPSQPDWASIEAEYREGGYSLREMARRHACSHSSIANRARRQGWVRGEDERASNAVRMAPTGERRAARDRSCLETHP